MGNVVRKRQCEARRGAVQKRECHVYKVVALVVLNPVYFPYIGNNPNWLSYFSEG